MFTSPGTRGRSIMFEAGFEILEGVLTEAECDALIAHLCENGSLAGVRHLMSDPFVSRLAVDGRLLAITEQISGQKLVPYKATLFQKTGKANWLVAWHQDTALPVEAVPNGGDWGPTSVKDGITFAHAPARALSKILALRIHLDASTKNNGPLRVIPGSHRFRMTDRDEFREWTTREASA